MVLKWHLAKNIVLAYLPATAAALLIGVVANLGDSASEDNCWRIIREKNLLDYIVYFASFVLPNTIALALLVIYLIGYFSVASSQHNRLLILPLCAVVSMVYYLVLKLMVFFGEWDLNELLELPFLVDPLVHSLIFLSILARRSKNTLSDLTI